MEQASTETEIKRGSMQAQVEALKGIMVAKRYIEHAANIIVQCAALVDRPKIATRGVKLLERGWEIIDNVIGNNVSQEAIGQFWIEVAEMQKRAEEDEARRFGGVEGGAQHGDSGVGGEAPLNCGDPGGEQLELPFNGGCEGGDGPG